MISSKKIWPYVLFSSDSDGYVNVKQSRRYLDRLNVCIQYTIAAGGFIGMTRV